MLNFLNLFVGFISPLLIMNSTNYQDNPILIKLDSFLSDKNSPIPAMELVKYDNWQMIVALSAAESSYGKYMAGGYNAWGIKDFESGSFNFGRTRDFNSWEESIEYTSDLLYQYDPENGSPSPRNMVKKWKYIPPYEHWINNVEYSLYDIAENVL